MKNLLLPALLLTVGAQLALVSSARATSTLADWTFEGYSTSGVNASPAPAIGTGTATPIGMTLDGSSEDTGISNIQGTDGSNDGTGNLAWKVRGHSGGNGWDSSEAIATQGAQFAVSTVGDTAIVATFDWYPSTTGEANLLIQYTTDGSTYVDLPSADITIPSVSTLTVATNTTSSNTVMGSYLDATAGNTWYNGITLNFSSIAATANDPNFGFRLVNASTGSDVVTAQAAGTFSNSSGNWSFDDVDVVGVAPEPSTWALFGLGLGALWVFALKRGLAVGRRIFLLPWVGLVFAFLAAENRAAAQTPLFTQGDIIVSTYGNVNGALNNNPTYGSTDFSIANDGVPTPITLEEFSAAIVPTDTDTPILTDTLPTTGTGANVGIVGEDGSSSEGTLQLSGNDEYLTIGGYDGNQDENGAPNGGYSNANGVPLAQATDTNVPRVAALVDAEGNVNTSTVLNDVYDTQNIRSVYTTDGSTVYTSGQTGNAYPSTTQGIFYTTTGNNTAVTGTAPTEIYDAHDTRDVQAYGGNLYYSMNTTSHAGVFMYNGLPTTGSATATELTPLSGTVNGQTTYFSPEGFYFASPTVLYVADTGSPKAYSTSNPVLGDGGIQKWVLTNSTWTLEYTLTPSNFVADSATTGETGFEGLAGQVVNGVVDLYAVSYTLNDAEENGLYAVADTLSSTTGSGDTITELEQSGTNGTFKGVSFAPEAAPEPSTFSFMALTLLGVGAFAWKRRRALGA